ncbi:MAG: carbon-nitrogen family hydrolase [Candidatus Ancaeobacter aquaticus]|nr:carbon-nitrogen family hydrolase [Candidatus Ancaeobacter aquaticus]
MKLTISIAQIDVAITRPQENIKKAEPLITEAVKRGSDLICFPEMWTTGFNWGYNERNAQDHEKISGQISQLANKYKIWINGSILSLNENQKVSNTSILFDKDGVKAGVYRKTHLFSLLHEEKHMEAGDKLTLVDTPWGLIGLTVCYDIRFPELFRTYALKGAKMILSPMAFPHSRLDHWKVLVRARAIENQMFIIGTNQVGTEDFGEDGIITYCGDSVIIDPWGHTVIQACETQEELLTTTIDTDLVDETRKKMEVFKDRRTDLYEL